MKDNLAIHAISFPLHSKLIYDLCVGKNKNAILSKWLISILVLFIFVGFLMIAVPELGSNIPKYKCLSYLEEIITSNPYTIAFFLSAFCLVFLFITVMSSIISNAKFRSYFQKKYKTNPEAFTAIKERSAKEDNFE